MPQEAPRLGEDRLRPLWDPADLTASETRLRSALGKETSDAGRAEILTQLARVELKRGRPDEAHRFLNEADALAGETPVVRARVLLERGRVTRHFGDPDEAKRLLEQAVEAALAADQPFIAADATHSRALAGDIVEWTNRGLGLAARYEGAAYWRGTLLINLGEWQWERGDRDGALASFENAMRTRERDGRNRGQLNYARYGVARSLRSIGRAGEAVPLLEQAMIGATADGDNANAERFRRELAAAVTDASRL